MRVISNKLSRQVAKYLIVGFASNAALYLLFLALISNSVPNVVALSLSYLAGTLFTFFANAKWTFSNLTRSNLLLNILKFLVLYFAGYIVSIFFFQLVTNYFGASPLFGQAATMVLCAIFLFLGQKFWVFR